MEPLGPCELAELRLRALVADGLGVGLEELRPEVSLTDDLAADSLDLLELVMAVERELGIVIPERVLDDLRTYGDLLSIVADGVRHGQRVSGAPELPAVRARILPPVGPAGAFIERAVLLTPYLAETIVDQARCAGRGARLELEVASGTCDADVSALQERFAGLGERGVVVQVRRQPFGPSLAPPLSARASASR